MALLGLSVGRHMSYVAAHRFVFFLSSGAARLGELNESKICSFKEYMGTYWKKIRILCVLWFIYH